MARIQLAGVVSNIILEQGMSDIDEVDLEALLEDFLESPSPETFSETVTGNSNASSNQAECLSDEKLKFLLENFAKLTTNEQLDLVKQLSVIEKTDDKRVDK